MAIIGLDAGSTGCKSILFCDSGVQLAYAYREYKSTGNVFEVDANEVWRCVCEVIRETATQTKEQIRALAVSSFGETFAAVDEKGNVLAHSLLYSSPCGAEQCARMVEMVGMEEWMRITGAKPHPMYSLPKIGWLRENRPVVFEQAKHFFLMEDFLIFRLCGKAYTDYSMAARTMAFDIVHKKWEPSLLALAGIEEGFMAKAVPSGTAVEYVLPSIAVELGLGENTLIVTGGHDQVCAAVGAGVTHSGIAVDATGTVECITPVFDAPMTDAAFLNQNYACVPYAVENKYTTYAVNFTGGSLLKWYRDHFARLETAQAKAQGRSVYALLDEQAYTFPTDLLIVPHFAGSGTPDMDPAAKGGIFGLSLETTPSMLYRAMLEGITYEMKYNMDCLHAAGIAIHTLKAAGGGARSGLWLQMKADITGCPIIPLSTEEAGATGAAMLAAVACGIYPDLEQAAKKFVREKEAVEPLPQNQAVYAGYYEKYLKARQFLK